MDKTKGYSEMLNSDRYINAFNKVEKWLQEATKLPKGTRFFTLLEAGNKSFPVVRQFKNDLAEFADLRNAIVHERTDEHVIAEPNDRVVTDIEKIVDLLYKPPTVRQLFLRQVSTLTILDTVDKAVQIMLSEKISQLPVYDGTKFVELFTSNTVARWLGSKVEDDIFSLKEATVSDVLDYTEDKGTACFLKMQANVFEAKEKFEGYERQGRRLEAILITPNGTANESPKGIITAWDLSRIYKLLE